MKYKNIENMPDFVIYLFLFAIWIIAANVK